MKLYLILLLIPFANPPLGYRQLTWEDFKGQPSGDHAAMTYCGIYLHTNEVNGTIATQWAESYFDGHRSWTRTKSRLALSHEQGHFNIAEYYSRQIKDGINTDSLLVIYQQEQVRYDAETNHGTDTVAQKAWEQKIKL